MAGRKRRVSLDTLYKKFDENEEKIVCENKVVAPKNPIWDTIYLQVGRKSTPKAIYTDALNWYKGRKAEIVDESSEENDISDISIEMDPAIDSDESYVSDDERAHANDINFTITLSYDVWNTIKPVPTENRRKDKTHKTNVRIYYTLPPGVWSNILIDRIAQHRIKNPCTWSFKRAKVYQSGKKYISLSAKCTTCDASLIGQVKNEPKDSDASVKFTFVIREFNEEKHMNNRRNVRIGGSKANEIFSSTRKASVLRRAMIKESGDKMFEPEKGRVISENAIRAGQCRRRQLDKLSTDPVKSLEFMKASNAYGSMIHWLGVDPFFVIYGSSNQFLLFDAYKKHNEYSRVACDATGSIVHKLGK